MAAYQTFSKNPLIHPKNRGRMEHLKLSALHKKWVSRILPLMALWNGIMICFKAHITHGTFSAHMTAQITLVVKLI